MEVIDLYKNLGILEIGYKDQGGIGFELIKDEYFQYPIIIFSEEFEKYKEIREQCDLDGIERQFCFLGTFEKSNNDVVIIIRKVLVDNSENNLDGKAHRSKKYCDDVALASAEFQVMLMCHTHPNLSQSSYSINIFDSINEKYGEELKLREYGLNISNGDLKMTISDTSTAKKTGKVLLEGISLPNGEFNFFGLDGQILKMVTQVYAEEKDGLNVVQSFWTKSMKKAKQTK